MWVLAVEDLRVASMPMTEFKRLLPRYPQLAVALLMDVVARLRRSVQFTKSFTMEGVYARLVKLLLARAVQTDGKLVADVTHTEIGHRVGATREMVGVCCATLRAAVTSRRNGEESLSSASRQGAGSVSIRRVAPPRPPGSTGQDGRHLPSALREGICSLARSAQGRVR